MGYLYQIVELGSAGDVCAAHHRSVDCCIGAYFNIVGKLHNAELLDFVIYAIGIRSEAEAIGTEYGTGVDHAAGTDFCSVIYFRTGIDHGIVTDSDAVADICLRINLHILAELHSAADIGERSDI